LFGIAILVEMQLALTSPRLGQASVKGGDVEANVKSDLQMELQNVLAEA
jgi:hypothetical protein